MTTVTEGIHAGAFLESEANGYLSRETATVKSGAKYKAGTVMVFSSGKLVASTGDVADGALVTPVEGILFDNVDATGGDVPNCVYIARLAEVKDSKITYPASNKAAVVASLAKLHIRPR